MKKEKPKKQPQELTEREIKELMGHKTCRVKKSQRRGNAQKIKGELS
ncbi:hypothetical protein [Bacillus altitudinis]|nr:hypothetical protein [Bacillus altitudinis]